MALKSINGGGRKFITPDESIGSTSLEVGGIIEGYLLLIESYTDKDDLVKTPMYFLRKDDTVLRVYPSGNIKYAIEDGKLTLGQFTQITRVEDKKVKGRTSSQFDIAQDDENVVDLETALAPIYAKSAAAYAARKEAEGGQRPGGTVTKGMTKNEKARANTASKAKLLE
jgi:hypothetical protein